IIIRQFFRGTMLEYLTFYEQVGAIANGKCFRYVVVCDEDSDVLVLKPCHNGLDVFHRNGIDTGEGVIQKNELGVYCKRTSDFSPTSFSTAKDIAITLPHMG